MKAKIVPAFDVARLARVVAENPELDQPDGEVTGIGGWRGSSGSRRR